MQNQCNSLITFDTQLKTAIWSAGNESKRVISVPCSQSMCYLFLAIRKSVFFCCVTSPSAFPDTSDVKVGEKNRGHFVTLTFFICFLACLLLLTPRFCDTFWRKLKAKKNFAWHQIRLKRRGIMTRKKHVQSFFSLWNKCLLRASARQA